MQVEHFESGIALRVEEDMKMGLSNWCGCQDLCFRPVLVLMFFHCQSVYRMLVTSHNHCLVMHTLS